MVNEDKNGTIKFGDEVIASCALNAIIRTSGVHSLNSNLSDSRPINILNKHSPIKGIKITQDGDIIKIDLQVNMTFGYKIPEVAWNVQENVKKEVESMTGKKVSSVNIFVKGVFKEIEAIEKSDITEDDNEKVKG